MTKYIVFTSRFPPEGVYPEVTGGLICVPGEVMIYKKYMDGVETTEHPYMWFRFYGTLYGSLKSLQYLVDLDYAEWKEENENSN